MKVNQGRLLTKNIYQARNDIKRVEDYNFDANFIFYFWAISLSETIESC